MTQQEFTELLNKYQNGECIEEETALIESWYIQFEFKKLPALSEEQLEDIWMSRPVPDNGTKKISLMSRIAAAAAVLLIGSIGILFYLNNRATPSKLLVSKTKNDIKPGGSKAFLTLANGKRIALTNEANGELVKQAGVQITKKAGGKLIYTVVNKNADNPETAAEYNTIETPPGGKYEVNLPDGTHVWLNAASSLKYPAFFSGKERKVELNGEAYFEVAKNKAMPFIVKTAAQQVEVLGTHFNINSYTDEPETRTTLLEGSVKVKQNTNGDSRLLKPGQQSVLSEEKLSVAYVDTEAVIAWKNGDFVFKDDDFKMAMRKIARWYNVEVVYDPSASYDLVPGGWVSRSKNISAVLKVMALTGKVHFKLEGRRITVTK
jgi:ferric-dicitrate binding protein FerR (iron transport regulator)